MSGVDLNLLYYLFHDSFVSLFHKVKKSKLYGLILHCNIGIEISRKYILEMVLLKIADDDSDYEDFYAISVWFGGQMETCYDDRICLVLEFGESHISGPKQHAFLQKIFQELLGLAYLLICKFM